MALLEWTNALVLDLDEMDRTHHEFVDLLAQVEAAPDATLVALWAELVAHTDIHFGQEDEWMRNTGFSASNCHSLQHKVVLQVMREGLRNGEQGQLQSLRQMAAELAAWFPSHAQSMDAALALHLRGIGYNPLTGQVQMPQALPTQPIHGCGGHACSDHAGHATADAVAAV
jgi:hemerythrin-like metal-binding protein